MMESNVKPTCFEQVEEFDVNNGKCSNCYWCIECSHNFLECLDKQITEAVENHYHQIEQERQTLRTL